MNPWRVYDALIATIPEDAVPEAVYQGPELTGVMYDGTMGIAMTYHYEGQAPRHSSYEGKTLRELAESAKSWNYAEAAVGVAAINSYWNRQALLETQDPAAAFESYRPFVHGKKIAVVGHFPYISKFFGNVADVIVLEREDIEGDYPDSACEYLLADRDLIFLTGSAFVNKTITRLLELSRGKEVILLGPTTPMAPVLYDFGVTGLSGFVVTDTERVVEEVLKGDCTGIFQFGEMVNLRKDPVDETVFSKHSSPDA